MSRSALHRGDFADKNVGRGKDVTSPASRSRATDAGNYNLLNTTAATTATIWARDLTVTATGVDRVYDGTAVATVTLASDALEGDDVALAYTAASFADKNVGEDKDVSVEGISIAGDDAGNYNLLNTTAATTATIWARDLTVTATGVDRVYDGTAVATVTLASDALEGDDVALAYTAASFADKNVGEDKDVSVEGISIAGDDAGNYNLLNTTAATTATIWARDLTVTATGVDRVYDGTAVATVTLASDALEGDDVALAYTAASFADKNVGEDKDVSVEGISIAGDDAGNYNLLNTTAATTATIWARDLTVTATGVDRVYDGTAVATVTLASDALEGDDVALAYTAASFADKNVGEDKDVSVEGISIAGDDAGNYNLLNTTAATTATIWARDLTVTATGVDRVYDGTAVATVTLASDALEGDDVALAYTAASFADKNVGEDKDVSVEGISIAGDDAGNYNLLNTTAATTATICARDLTVTATGVDRVYDGTAVATVTLASDALEGDDVALAYTAASFADKNVGEDKDVSVEGISIAGDDAGNYNLLNTTAATTATIWARDLTVTATGVDRVYDGTAVATVTLASDALEGDDVALAYTAASFADKNVGEDKDVSVEGISIAGDDAGNYNLLNTTAATTATIWARDLTVTATGVDRVYDGTAVATVTLASDALEGDDVALAYTAASFADKNVGEDKDVSVEGISIAGDDAGNYNLLNTTAATTATIWARDLTVTADPQTKDYGQPDPSLTWQITAGDLVNDDTITGELAREAGEDIGDYAILLGTLDAGSNYALTFVPASLTIVDTTAPVGSIWINMNASSRTTGT